MTIIADGGSTKTHWVIDRRIIETDGINPTRDTREQIAATLTDLPQVEAKEVRFYGAGCIDPFKDKVAAALADKFPTATITVESDMVGAALAVCGPHEGVACILGTGSNSCLWDGRRMVANTPPLGYILGDEGSGAALGKRLVGDYLKGLLPRELAEAFANEIGLTQAEIIERVYRQPKANRFLASLAPFLSHHSPQTDYMVVQEFRLFLRRNVLQYRRPDLRVSFVGSVAHHFRTQLAAALAAEGLKAGTIAHTPIFLLAE